mmetsp:Transcript_7791/g.11276  ORF Transcript_7791/g.11276 Transcript_7791/m.11276 type:complete len:210 (-) Transcript_7791:112-741(-)
MFWFWELLRWRRSGIFLAPIACHSLAILVMPFDAQALLGLHIPDAGGAWRRLRCQSLSGSLLRGSRRRRRRCGRGGRGGGLRGCCGRRLLGSLWSWSRGWGWSGFWFWSRGRGCLWLQSLFFRLNDFSLFRLLCSSCLSESVAEGVVWAILAELLAHVPYLLLHCGLSSGLISKQRVPKPGWVELSRCGCGCGRARHRQENAQTDQRPK